MEHVEQVQLICVLETVSVVLQGVVTVGFISVPSLFYLAAEEDGMTPEEKEAAESSVTTFLIFTDAFLMFLLITQIIVVAQLKAGWKEKNPAKLRSWLLYNLLFYFVVMAGTITGILYLTYSYLLHIFNFCFLMYRGWTLIQVLLFYRELSAREPLNDKTGGDIEVSDS